MSCPIPVLLSSSSLLNFDLDSVMALAAEVGFDGIELVVDWRRETYQPDHLQKLMSRHHLPILAVHSPFTRMFMPDWPDDPVDSLKKSVRLAEQLGAQTVVVHPPERWLRLQGLVSMPDKTYKLSLPLPIIGRGRLGRWLQQELAGFQAATEVRVAVENMPCRPFGPINLEPHHFYTPEMLNQFQYLTFDTTHVGTRGMDLLAFYKQVEAQVAHVHLSNYNGQEHQLPDNGNLPLAAFLNRLAQSQFEGLVSLETGPSSLQAEDGARLRYNLQKSLDFCHKNLT